MAWLRPRLSQATATAARSSSRRIAACGVAGEPPYRLLGHRGTVRGHQAEATGRVEDRLRADAEPRRPRVYLDDHRRAAGIQGQQQEPAGSVASGTNAALAVQPQPARRPLDAEGAVPRVMSSSWPTDSTATGGTAPPAAWRSSWSRPGAGLQQGERADAEDDGT